MRRRVSAAKPACVRFAGWLAGLPAVLRLLALNPTRHSLLPHATPSLLQEERARAAAERRVREQLDPEALARHYLLPKDEQIR